MAPRSVRGRGVRAILAAGLFALVASSMAANAGPGDAPQLATTTLGTGWLKANTAVAVEFDKILAPTSTVAVQDMFANTAVAGTTSVVGRGIAFVPTAPLIEDGRNYQATVTVSGVEGTPNFVYTKAFKVDNKTPNAPAITAPEGITIAGPRCDGAPICDIETMVVLGPADTFEGIARDILGQNGVTAATSGIQRIELQFWNVVDQAIGLPEAILSNRPTGYSFKVSLGQACGATCPLDVDPWSISASEIEDLSTGVWTMRAIAVDYAGNISSASKGVTFVSA